MENVGLKAVQDEKYLGVAINSTLSWLPQAIMISNRANHKRQFLQRNLRTSNRETKLQCYNAYARPILEYASPAWNTKNKNDVEKKAARFKMSGFDR